MNKLLKDLRTGTLGAAAGLFSSSVILLVARIDSYYQYLALRDPADYGYQGVEALWWMPAIVWHLLLSIVASLLAHRYLTIRPPSTFLLWQVIGIASLIGWAFTAFLLIGLDCVMTGHLDSLRRIANNVEIGPIAKYVSTVFACNVFYGCVMSASSRQYAEQPVAVDDAAY